VVSQKQVYDEYIYVQLLFSSPSKEINNMPNSIHPTLTPFGSYAALHYVECVDNKYQSHTDNGVLLYLIDETTSNITLWIPGRSTVVIINRYTMITTSSSDSDFKINDNIIPSNISDFITTQ